jgi:RNA polymerase-binding protein DksA
MTDLTIIKTELVNKKNQLLKRVEAIENDLNRKKGPLNPDSKERAQEVENDEVLGALDEIERNELNHINSALKRIDEGQYGTCESCGNNINFKRLEALPTATLCIQCADK